MNAYTMQKMVVVSMLALAGTSGAWAQENARDRQEGALVDLHQEIASPLQGQFALPGESIRSGQQQDFGGISGNTNGFDGMPTANGDPSGYTSPEAGGDSSTSPGSGTTGSGTSGSSGF